MSATSIGSSFNSIKPALAARETAPIARAEESGATGSATASQTSERIADGSSSTGQLGGTSPFAQQSEAVRAAGTRIQESASAAPRQEPRQAARAYASGGF